MIFQYLPAERSRERGGVEGVGLGEGVLGGYIRGEGGGGCYEGVLGGGVRRGMTRGCDRLKGIEGLEGLGVEEIGLG